MKHKKKSLKRIAREWDMIRMTLSIEPVIPSPCRNCVWSDVNFGKVLCSRECDGKRCYYHK